MSQEKRFEKVDKVSDLDKEKVGQGNPPQSWKAAKEAFAKFTAGSIDNLFEFYERTDEIVAHQTGYIQDYEKWLKIRDYTVEHGGKAEQDGEDKSWYFTFPKPVQQEEKPSGLPLHLQNSPAPEEKTTEKEESREPVEPDEDERYSLKDSISKVGRLYPVLVDAHGNVIDGYHRLEADPDWPKHKVEDVTDPVQLTIARLIANVCRRDISDEEKTEWLGQLAELTGWTPKKIAENLPLSYQWVIKYIPDVLKEKSWDREPILRRRIGQEDVKKDAEKSSETEDLTEKQQKPVPCELCGKPTSKPLHLKGKYYCEACAEKALSKHEPKPVEEEYEAEEPEEPQFNVDRDIAEGLVSENVKWILQNSTGDLNYRTTLKLLTDEELEYCLEHEKRSSGRRLLEMEKRRREKGVETTDFYGTALKAKPCPVCFHRIPLPDWKRLKSDWSAVDKVLQEHGYRLFPEVEKDAEP